MAKDVTALIEADHREVEKLFDQLKSGKGDRAGLAQEVGRMLLGRVSVRGGPGHARAGAVGAARAERAHH